MIEIKLKNHTKIVLRRIKQLIVRKISTKNFKDDFIANDFGFGRGTPVDRFYIDHFFRAQAAEITGSCLEFGDTSYIEKYGVAVTEKYTFNYSEESLKVGDTLMGDVTKLDTLSANIFDSIVCVNVLNFIYDLPAAMLGLKKMLKPSGKIVLTVAGVSAHISRYDMDRWGDYWRLTDKAAIKVVEDAGFHVEKMQIYGNPYACSAQINGFSVEDLSKERLHQSHPDYQLVVAFLLSR